VPHFRFSKKTTRSMMRLGILLLSVLLSVVPAMASGGLGSHGRYHTSRSYSSRSYRSPSYRSSYRTHSYPHHSHQSRSPRSYQTSSYRSGRISTDRTVQRDSHGRIKRSAAAKDAFKRQHPCPSTGRGTGACPGYGIDHVRPLAVGGADAPSNMQWQTKAAAKEKDKWERKV
jgi:hypothetical protein